ncbi:MAG: hypothetical protein ABSE48_21150, partial [Verrucomicrobiota bacterium]
MSSLTDSVFGQGTAFLYQGHLEDQNTPANGNYDLEFTIYDAARNGDLLGMALTNFDTSVSNGLFTVSLDFGAVFTGQNCWLDVSVRTNGGSAFSELSPRQPIQSVPYAIMANGASNLLGSLPVSQLSGTLATGQFPASVVTNGASGLNLAGVFSGSGAGLTGLNASQLTNGIVPNTTLSSGVVINSDVYSASWATYIDPYTSNYMTLNAVGDFTNSTGLIHWLSTRIGIGLVSDSIPDVGGIVPIDQTGVNGFEIGLAGDQAIIDLGGNGSSFNIQVDGGVPQRFVVPSNQGGAYYLALKFPTYANRLIRVEGGPLQLIDLETTNTDSFYSQRVAVKKILFVGDSFLGGADGVDPQDTFGPDYLKVHQNADVWCDAVGGTGYCATNADGNNYLQRLTNWVIPNPFDAIIVTGSVNDGGAGSNLVYAAASLYYQTVRSNY